MANPAFDQSAAWRSNAKFALVDPALCPKALRHDMARSRTPLTVGSISARTEPLERVLPFIVTLPSQGPSRQSQLELLAQWSWETHGVTFIDSPLGAPLLAACLSNRQEILVSDSQRALLRVCDSRVLPVFVTALEASQLDAFLMPVHAWWYFDREEILRCLEGDSSTEIDAWPSPFQLSAQQEHLLLCEAEADTVLALLADRAPIELHQLPRSQRHSFVVGQLKNAAGWQVTDGPEQALYCLVALHHGPTFDQEPEWIEWLAQVKDRKLTLIEAIESVEVQHA